MRQQPELRSVSQHQRIVADLIRRRAPVVAGLASAFGRVLADDVTAPIPLPLFDNSAMDGYAVRAVDVVRVPTQLPVVEDIPAGRGEGLVLTPGTAHRVMTGAPMPAGADAVIPMESTDGGTAVVRIHDGATAGNFVRCAGVDVRKGDVILRAGTVLGAPQIGLLAAVGMTTVGVVPPLRVAVLSTGTELVRPGQPLRSGQIYDSNSIMLATALRGAGAHADTVHFVSDDVAQFNATFAQLGDYDLVLTSGGVSAGAYEVVKDALSGHGVEFAKVAMQPGMPQGAGSYEGIPVVALPGNPVSSLVSFEVFVRPAVRTAMGYRKALRDRVTVRLAEPLDAPPEKRQFRRGSLDLPSGTVSLAGPAGSHFLGSLAGADCLIDVPEDATRMEAGATVSAWLLD
ncbi:molybdopterin molybdotransferase MoeA [Pimelobacter simplex]|nr:molybdopterin molybdotransferase MoeA [Pimelobacter simplex]UUW96351.1 molybdopterin molybdotransferase MoeA [Pimelobacter simplex]